MPSSLLERIKAVQWQSYVQPKWNKPSSIADALAGVVRADPDAYNTLLYAVGNNHAGTYYPVLLTVMPFLEEIVCGSDISPQHTVLSALIDLFASFHPEPMYEETEIPGHGRQMIEVAFQQRVRALAPTLEVIAGSGSPNSSLARELLDLFSEDTA